MKKFGLWVVIVCLLCSLCACQAHQPNMASSSDEVSSSESPVSSETVSSPISSQPYPVEEPNSGTQSLQKPEPLVQKEKLQSLVMGSALSNRGTVTYWRYYRNGMQDGLSEYKTPEKIVKLFFGGGIGESGAFYRFPEISSFTATTERIEKIELPADTVQISAGYGDFALVTGAGELYTVGGLSLYGGRQLIGQDAFQNEQNQVIRAIVPEPVQKAVMTEFYLFILGKSGAIYAAPRNCETVEDLSVFPQKRPAAVFKRLPAAKTVSDICAALQQTVTDEEGTDLRGNVLWIRYEDGSLAYVDECRQIYTTLKKLIGGKWPVLEVKNASAGGEKVQKMLANDNLSAIVFQADSGDYYAMGIDRITVEKQTAENERVPQKLSLPNGARIKKVYPGYSYILMLDDTGKTWIAGSDSYQILQIGYHKEPWIPWEISGIDWDVLQLN